MNGLKSSDAQTTSANPQDSEDITVEPSRKGDEGTSGTHKVSDSDKVADNEDESEAETLITSPVKQKEAAKRGTTVATDTPEDAPSKQAGIDDEADAPGSEDELPAARGAKIELNAMDIDDELSELSDMSEQSVSSRDSSRSRAVSELPTASHNSPNPRKRKHRASSVSLPNKRRSVDAPRRRLRGAPDDARHTNDGSESPRNRTHRRAASTQSFLDGTGDATTNRKRRTAPQLVSRDLKQSRWEESSVSSEATSHGQGDAKRPQRGIGRSTSGAGRPVGREHKRHVNKYGFTRLAEACESGDVELVKEWREKDPEQLELAEFAGNKPLQIAALNGNAEVVEYLIGEGCQVDCANVDKDTPLIDAAENGHLDVVHILLKAGVDPLRQNLKGQQALDVVSDDTDNATEIRAALRGAIETWNSVDAKQRREEEEVQRYRAGPAKELHFMARTYENLLRLVTINDRNGVREFLDARVPVDNAVIAAAAKTGDLYLMNMLLAEMTDKKRSQKAEKPMLSVIGTSHFDMVKSLTELDHFNPLWMNRQGKKWSEIAEEKAGPMWRQEVELLQGLERLAENKQGDDRRSSSPIMRRSEALSKHRRLSATREDDEGEEEDEEDIASDDEDALDDTPRRKNGRRLLSRKDLQAASRRTKGSDDSGSAEESDQERAKPPEPKEKRGPGRPRTKGISIKNEESIETPTNRDPHRRRSTSTNNPIEKVTPTTTQSTTKKNGIGKTVTDDAEVVAPNVSAQLPDTPSSLTDSTAQQRAAEQAAQGNADTQQRLAAEQEQEEKAAQRHREEVEAMLKEFEAEGRRQRQLKAAAMEAVRISTRRKLIEALPEPLSWILDPDSDFDYEEHGAMDTLLEFCEPLQVIYPSDLGSNLEGTAEPLVLNLAVAPLLGKGIGLQVLLPDNAVDTTVFETLTPTSFFPGILIGDERHLLDGILLSSGFVTPAGQHEEVMVNGHHSYAQQLARSAATHQSRKQLSGGLSEAPLVLRWLSLQQVINRLHPTVQQHNITVREDWRGMISQGLSSGRSKVIDHSFFFGVCRHWETSVIPTCRYAQPIDRAASQMKRGATMVEVLHGK